MGLMEGDKRRRMGERFKKSDLSYGLYGVVFKDS